MPIREGVEISIEDAKEYDGLMDLSEFNNRLQFVYKIKLNSKH